MCVSLFHAQHEAHNPEEDLTVFGGNPPEPVWGCADAVRGQAAVHAVPRAGAHGGHAGLPPRGDAAGSDSAGTQQSLPGRHFGGYLAWQEQWCKGHQNMIK